MQTKTICVIGLGYVGLPLALAFAKKYPVIGFDVSSDRISQLQQATDKNNDVPSDELNNALDNHNIVFSNVPEVIHGADTVIVCVPTPINQDKTPDLRPIEGASKLVGKYIKKDAIVVFESTVYPGLTEEICIPLLEEQSGMTCNKDFYVGYSPERINPGDLEHTFETITKVVSASHPKALETIKELYSSVVKAGVHVAPNIKTAEAAKVIENIQRDLNIALMNELSLIFHDMGIKTKDVLDAASTKWNFHNYSPGLVGGHCIPVDPYYLTAKAERLGHFPQIILSGRKINNYMSVHVARLLEQQLECAGKTLRGSKVIVMGLTFKPDVKDTRNSMIKPLIESLKQSGAKVGACDPHVSTNDAKKYFGVHNIQQFESLPECDAIIYAVNHKNFNLYSLQELNKKMKQPVLIDVPNRFLNEDHSNIYYDVL